MLNESVTFEELHVAKTKSEKIEEPEGLLAETKSPTDKSPAIRSATMTDEAQA